MEVNKCLLVNLPKWGSDSGFFVYLEFMINSIIYSLENKYFHLPIPDFDYSYNKYLQNNVFFDNYFTLTYLYKNLLRDKKIIKEKRNSQFWCDIHHNYGICCYPHDSGKDKELVKLYNSEYTSEIHNWYYNNRVKANEILTKYIKINDNIINKVNLIYNKLFNKDDYIIGCHIRGTDKKSHIGGDKICPTDYYKYIDYLLKKNNDKNVKIFLATDDSHYFNEFTSGYKDKVKYYDDVLRSEKNAFLDSSIKNNYKKGEDVLIDCLLLSKCDFLLKCSSAVSEFSIFYNLKLHNNSYNLQYNCINKIKL